ncbi:MAG TPA: alpha/beta fold hydrolase [Candidatus Thermoplasmatota archaeon]|nr:alpha/beta fold hydrolase [Candidatus Thermoplasmatota archaeon]
MPLRRVTTGSLYDQGETLRVNGLDTWVVRAGPRGGTPVVFLHGVPTSAYLYREIVRAMHEDHDCIAFDWPGFGASEKPKRLDLSHRARMEHLRALLDQMGLARVHLVVHDMGGPAGLLLAVEHPERVERLVVLNTTVYKRDYRPPLPALTQLVPIVRDLARPLFQKPAFEFFFKHGCARPDRLGPDILENHWTLATRDDGLRVVFDTWAQIPEGAPSIERIRSRMHQFPGPSLVLFGADDPYLPPPNAERLAKALPGAELHLLPKAGHFLQEDAPEEVAERIMSFLAK